MKNPVGHETAGDADGSEPLISDRVMTIPNVICVIRLLGSVVLIPIAWMDQREAFLWFFLFLAMTDWIDGKLAIVLNQRSVFGARLDSWADSALYTALLIGSLMIFAPVLRHELGWILCALASYLISTTAGFLKYRRWPSYHTRAAKTSWFLIMLGAIALFTDASLWPLRIALAAAALTNLEALGITLISPVWRADVTSVYHAWRDRGAG